MSTTTLSLVKGQKIDLTKDNDGLTKLSLGLGWDANSGNSGAFDLDAFAICLNPTNKLHKPLPESVLYFNSPKQGDGTLAIYAGAVMHSGDNLTGAGDGDDETITIDFTKVPDDLSEILLAVNIFDSVARGNQNFGMVKNAFIHAYDANTKQELGRYDLSEDYSASDCVIFAKVYRHNGEWKFQAIGEGKKGTIADIAAQY